MIKYIVQNSQRTNAKTILTKEKTETLKHIYHKTYVYVLIYLNNRSLSQYIMRVHELFSLIAVLFTMVKLWSHPRCPSTDKGQKKKKTCGIDTQLYIQSGIIFSQKKD